MAREDFAGYFKAAGTGLEGNFGAVVDGLCEATEGQVPFDRIDLGHAGQEEEVGIGKEALARADHDAGAAHLGGQLLQEEDEAFAAGAGV